MYYAVRTCPRRRRFHTQSDLPFAAHAQAPDDFATPPKINNATVHEIAEEMFEKNEIADLHKVGNHLGFVARAYFFVSGNWTRAAGYYFISSKWRTADSRAAKWQEASLRSSCIHGYMVAYTKFQYDDKDHVTLRWSLTSWNSLAP